MSSLGPEPWQEIDPYLDHTLSRSEEERAEWLSDFPAAAMDLLLPNLLRGSYRNITRYPGDISWSINRSRPTNVLYEKETSGPYQLIVEHATRLVRQASAAHAPKPNDLLSRSEKIQAACHLLPAISDLKSSSPERALIHRVGSEGGAFDAKPSPAVS